MKWLIRHRRPIMAALTCLFVLFIFSNSLQNGTDSGNRSGFVTELLNRFLEIFGLSVSEHFIRKAAHFSEYFVLGLLLLLTLRAFTARLAGHVTVPLFLGLLVPVCDESLQLLIPGRSGMVSDVLIDFTGVLTGIGVCVLAVFLIQHHMQHCRSPL